MLSSLANYFYGSSADEPQPTVPEIEPQPTVPEIEPQPIVTKIEPLSTVPEIEPITGQIEKKPEEEEWDVLTDAVELCENTSSTDASNPPSEAMVVVIAPHDAAVDPDRQNGAVLTRTIRRLTVPFGSISGAPALPDIKNVRAAQAGNQKESGKQLSAKALNRRNKTVKLNHGSSTSRKAPTMAFKSSGSARQLKQC